MNTRERLTLVFLALLPVHALLVTFVTRLTFGVGHAPAPLFAVWKELFLAVILVYVLLELFFAYRRGERWMWQYDILDVLIATFVFLAVLISVVTHQDWKLFLIGFRYDCIALVAFLFLRRASWSPEFQATVRTLLITVGALVAVYGLLTLLMPGGWFVFLGYSDLHSLYIPNAPIPAFHNIEDSILRRIQSTFSGPNQFGLWLLIPLSLLIPHAFHCTCKKGSLVDRLLQNAFIRQCFRCVPTVVLLLIVAAMLFTFSRSVWIAGVIIAFVSIALSLPGEIVKKYFVRIGALIVFFFVAMMFIAPDMIIREGSTREHFVRPFHAFKLMLKEPYGQGLGMAGPASNRVSDACVFLPEGSNTDWALVHPELCVFLGTQQVQPLEKPCVCPYLPENWYLQVGVELGTLGFGIFVALILFTLLFLWRDRKEVLSMSVFLAFLGVSTAALVLHAWEDSALAYTLWMLVAYRLPIAQE